VDGVSGFQIASEECSDRPHPLIAGSHEERRRTSVAFHTDREISGLRMRKLIIPVRRDTAA
jgi:hypothetical protein